MKSILKRPLLAAAIMIGASSIALVAVAQDAPVTNFLDKGFPVTPAGTVDGMQVYTLGDDSAVWYRLPDGSVIAGYGFDKNGKDLNAQVLNQPPMDAWASIGMDEPAAQGTSDGDSAQALISSIQSALNTLPESGAVTSKIKPSNSASLGEQSKAAIDATMAATAKTIDTLPDAKKRELLLDLLAQIKAANNPADFQLRVIEWNEKVSGKKLISDDERAKLEATSQQMDEIQSKAKGVTEDHSANDAPAPKAPGDAKLPSVTVTPLPALHPSMSIGMGGAKLIKASAEIATPAPGNTGNATPAEAVRSLTEHPLEDPRAQLRALQSVQADQAKVKLAAKDNGAPTAKVLFSDIKTKGFAFTYGSSDAPPVYLLADPLCPHCAKAIGALKPAVDAGKIQLHVLPVPVISKNSPGALATIMLKPDPAKAFWDHEMNFLSTGRPSMDFTDFSKLSKAQDDALHGNYDIVAKYELPGVPFFAWNEADGPHFYAGEPTDKIIARLEGALK